MVASVLFLLEQRVVLRSSVLCASRPRDDASMNPSSIRFVLPGVHMQMTLEVLHKDLESDEHLDEVVLFFRKCQRLQWHLNEVVLFSANVSGCNVIWRTTLSSSVHIPTE